jgi:hypothetical protein
LLRERREKEEEVANTAKQRELDNEKAEKERLESGIFLFFLVILF